MPMSVQCTKKCCLVLIINNSYYLHWREDTGCGLYFFIFLGTESFQTLCGSCLDPTPTFVSYSVRRVISAPHDKLHMWLTFEQTTACIAYSYYLYGTVTVHHNLSVPGPDTGLLFGVPDLFTCPVYFLPETVNQLVVEKCKSVSLLTDFAWEKLFYFSPECIILLQIFQLKT